MTTKKLIEVAVPLNAINKAVAWEKSSRHGHRSRWRLWSGNGRLVVAPVLASQTLIPILG